MSPNRSHGKTLLETRADPTTPAGVVGSWQASSYELIRAEYRYRPKFGLTWNGRNDDEGAMNKLCTLGGATIGSYLGWYLGSLWGIGGAFSVSAIASLVGVYLGWKISQRYA